jgi:hypothetical protein
MMTHYDVSTLHMDILYSQQIRFHPLTIRMQFAISFHFCNKNITTHILALGAKFLPLGIIEICHVEFLKLKLKFQFK